MKHFFQHNGASQFSSRLILASNEPLKNAEDLSGDKLWIGCKMQNLTSNFLSQAWTKTFKLQTLKGINRLTGFFNGKEKNYSNFKFFFNFRFSILQRVARKVKKFFSYVMTVASAKNWCIRLVWTSFIVLMATFLLWKEVKR